MYTVIYITYVISTLNCFRSRESFCPGDSRNLSVASGYSLRPWPRWPRIKPSPATVCASLIVVLVFHHLEIIFPRLLTRIDDRMEKRPRGVMTGLSLNQQRACENWQTRRKLKSGGTCMISNHVQELLGIFSPHFSRFFQFFPTLSPCCESRCLRPLSCRCARIMCRGPASSTGWVLVELSWVKISEIPWFYDGFYMFLWVF